MGAWSRLKARQRWQRPPSGSHPWEAAASQALCSIPKPCSKCFPKQAGASAVLVGMGSTATRLGTPDCPTMLASLSKYAFLPWLLYRVHDSFNSIEVPGRKRLSNMQGVYCAWLIYGYLLTKGFICVFYPFNYKSLWVLFHGDPYNSLVNDSVFYDKPMNFFVGCSN